MKTITEQADEYAEALPGHPPRLAYLAGAKYALEMAEDLADKMQEAAANILAKRHDDDAAAQHDTAKEISEAIRNLIPTES